MNKILATLLLGTTSAFAQIVETDSSIYSSMKELSKQYSTSSTVKDVITKVENKYSVECTGGSSQFFPDITKRVKYSALCTNTGPNGVKVKIISKFSYYLGTYSFELLDYKVSFIENKSGWIHGDVFQISCGLDDENLNKVIGNKCVLFTENGDEQYLGIIVNPNSNALYDGKLSQLENISFPPMSENCMKPVNNKMQDRLANLSATNTKYLNFNDSVERCWSGVSVTLGR